MTADSHWSPDPASKQQHAGSTLESGPQHITISAGGRQCATAASAAGAPSLHTHSHESLPARRSRPVQIASRGWCAGHSRIPGRLFIRRGPLQPVKGWLTISRRRLPAQYEPPLVAGVTLNHTLKSLTSYIVRRILVPKARLGSGLRHLSPSLVATVLTMNPDPSTSRAARPAE